MNEINLRGLGKVKTVATKENEISIIIDKEYFATRFAEVIYEIGTPWVKFLALEELHNLHERLMKSFDQQDEGK